MLLSRKRLQIQQTFLLSTNKKAHMIFRLAYLRFFTLTHSKGDDQVQANFVCEYLSLQR